MDNTYLSRMKFRKSLIAQNPTETIQCNPICNSAVLELHDWIFSTYLPARFPQIYHLNSSSNPGGQRSLFNTANSTSIPLNPQSPLSALRALGENIDTDFLLLMPSSRRDPSSGSDSSSSPIYNLEAFICCCPSGFTLRSKLGMPLAEIHTPVPGYKAKLEKSMDRFFARLECGRAVKRSNWTITTDDVLFKQGGTHGHGDDEDTGQQEEVVVENCRLRSERQTLFRLPQSRAIVFSFKTYMYTLSEIKNAGHAEALVEAIEGLRRGNVPEMNHYKRAEVWGKPVIEFLRR